MKAWWRSVRPRLHVAMGLWLLSRRLDMIEWRCRLEALI
jgi:hypothetical protein